MRAQAFLTLTLVALLGIAAGGAQPALAGAPNGIAQTFPTKCGVEGLAAGREGNVWFACTIETNSGYGTKPRVGRVTPAGQVTEFGAGKFPEDTEPGPIGVASGGDLWFPLNTFFRVTAGKRKPPKIARVTPSGEVTVFPLPLSAKYNVGDLVAGGGGYLWFTTVGTQESIAPGLWQIAPDGTISQLPIALATAPALEVGPEGDLWFTKKPASGGATEVLARLVPGGALTEIGTEIPGFDPATPLFAADGSGWFFIGSTAALRSAPTGVGRLSAAGAISGTPAQIPTTGTIAGSTVGSDGNLWFGLQVGPGASAIERVNASGQVTPFTACLDYSQPFFGPATLVTGGDGNIYFTSIASRSLPSISDPPSIGRITPSGEIAQIYAGVDAEARWILAGPDGAIWFSAGANQVQRIAPFSGPVNTFHVAPLKKASPTGAATARVVVPGPGTVSVEPLAFVPRHHAPVRLHGAAVTTTSTACTTAQLPIKPIGAAKRAFHQRGFTTEQVSVTYTPTGGTPYTEKTKLYFFGGKPHEKRTHTGPPPPGEDRGNTLHVPQAGQHFPIRPATLRFNYQPAGSYGEEEPSGRPLYPPFWITGLDRWPEWHQREERHGVPARAVATGTIHYDTCTPNCAHGAYATAPAHVKLDGEEFCRVSGGHYIHAFNRITVRVAGGPPRRRFIECNGKLRPGKRSDVIPPGVGFFH